MTQPFVLFADAALVAIDYLRDQLATLGSPAVVAKAVPDPRPDLFVTVVRGGGPRQTVVSDSAQLIIEAWGPTIADAHDLAQLARAVLHTMTGSTVDDTTVYRVDELAGPGELPDPLSAQPRVTFTVQVHLRGG